MSNNNKKPKQNFFDKNIRQYGDDFLSFLTADKIQRDAKQRIFREMIRGDIDYTVYGKYFVDPKFFENLLIAAYDELQNNMIISSAIAAYDMAYPGNNRVIILNGRYSSLAHVYNVLYGRLLAMKQNGYNIGFLSDLSATLYPYRNQL